jgi:hypothetical protein
VGDVDLSRRKHEHEDGNRKVGSVRSRLPPLLPSLPKLP